jgi:pyochelin biosynthetic protein PchC
VISSPSRAAKRAVRAYRTVPDCRLRIVCLPHAGGAASWFRDWGQSLPDGVELWAVQYPGRENRLGDPLPGGWDRFADDATEGVRQLLDRPVVLFGHSMGALIGYEVATRLTGGRERDAVRRLVVSGTAAPHRNQVFAGHEDAATLDDDGLVRLLRHLGVEGIGLLDDPAMRSVMLPAIRNDLRLVQAYRAERPQPLRIDVTALVGQADPFVCADQVRAWSALTSGRFRYRALPGGHFYLTRCRDEVLRMALDPIEPGGSS